MVVPFEELAWQFAKERTGCEFSIQEAACLRKQVQATTGRLVEFDRGNGDATALIASAQTDRQLVSLGTSRTLAADVSDFLDTWNLRANLELRTGGELGAPTQNIGFVLMHVSGEYRNMLGQILRVWQVLEGTSNQTPVVCIVGPAECHDDEPEAPSTETTRADAADAEEEPPDGEALTSAGSTWRLLLSRLVEYGTADVFCTAGRLHFMHKLKEFRTGLYVKAAVYAGECERHGEAERLYLELLELDGNSTEGLHEYGRLLVSRRRHEEAEPILRKAVSLKESHHYLNTLALTLNALGRTDEAIPFGQRACEIAPDYYHSANTLGWSYQENGQYGKSIAMFRRAMRLNPEYVHAQYNIGRALLATGELAEGWKQYEWRWKTKNFPTRRRDYDIPLWDGSSLNGKSILLWSEQGIGDQMIYASMIPDLVAMGATGVIEVGEKLVPVFQRSFPEFDVYFKAPEPHPSIAERQFDFQAPFASLGMHARDSLDKFPSTASFLKADEKKVAHWRKRLNLLDGNFKVGLAWRSSNVSGGRGKHYFTLEELEPLLRVPGCTFICVQYDNVWDEIRRVQAKLGCTIVRFQDLNLFDDIDSTIAMTRSLDVGVSSKYSSCLDMMAINDVPVLTFNCGLNERNLGTKTIPWYPSAEVFHCEPGDDRVPLIEQMAQRLAELVQSHRDRSQPHTLQTVVQT